MQSKIKLLALILIGFNINTSPVEAVTSQQISFYSATGVRQVFTNSLTTIPQAVTDAKSYCADLGLWKITTLVNTSPVTEYIGGDFGYEYCNEILGDAKPDYESIEFLGQIDLEIPTLSLFEKGKFQGKLTYVNTSQIAFNASTSGTFNSYFMTGASNWALYNNTDYTGQVTCLNALKESNGTFGSRAVRYMELIPYTIGSIQQGCNGEENQPTNRPGDGSGASNLINTNYIALIMQFIISLFFLKN